MREGFAIEELIFDGERVAGLRGHARGGASVSEKVRIVIGADGCNSLVARAVQAPPTTPVHHPPATTTATGAACT